MGLFKKNLLMNSVPGNVTSFHLQKYKLVSVAEKFGVEPRKLLSHVLEYELEW